MARKRAATPLPSLHAAVAQHASSPCTVQNLDAAITHPERVLCADSLVIFDSAYWYARIREVKAAHGLLHAMLGRFPEAQPGTGANTVASATASARPSPRSTNFAPGTRIRLPGLRAQGV